MRFRCFIINVFVHPDKGTNCHTYNDKCLLDPNSTLASETRLNIYLQRHHLVMTPTGSMEKRYCKRDLESCRQQHLQYLNLFWCLNKITINEIIAYQICGFQKILK